VNRHLVVLFILAAVTSALVMGPRHSHREDAAWWPATPPTDLGPWRAEQGAPEHILPSDPRAAVTFRRTYRGGQRVVWVAVAYYSFWGTPAKRPDVTLIAPAHGVARVARQILSVPVNGTSPQPMSRRNLVEASRGDQTVFVAYWYRLGPHVVLSEYELRARLFVAALRGRPEALSLVRVASTGLDDLRSFLYDAAPGISMLGS
jgi:EpsI family protein